MIETHPWAPFMPEGARVLIMGTFPPGNHRWSMDFYYPNRTNDFWKIMGLLFLNNPNALYSSDLKKFNEDAVRRLMEQHHVALNDTAREVRRLKGNASDKFLEILKPVPLYDLLNEMPQCHTIATTGEKAAGVIAEITGTPVPKMGEKVVAAPSSRYASELHIWRMPSTSRAYPLALEKKAAYYKELFHSIGEL